MGDSNLTQVLTSIFYVLGVLIIIFGAFVMAVGFGGQDGFQSGWNSRKKQGLIMMIAGACLMATTGLNNMLGYMGAQTCDTFPFVGFYAPALGLAIEAYGIAQLSLNWISDKFGDRVWGIRLIIAGMMIPQVGPVIDWILNLH